MATFKHNGDERLPGYGESAAPSYEEANTVDHVPREPVMPPVYFGSAKEYGIYYPRVSWIKDLVVRDDVTGRDAFFAAVSEARGKYDLVLHEVNTDGQILGMVDMRSSKSIRVIMGPSSTAVVRDEQMIELKRDKKLFGTSRFIMTVPKPSKRTEELRFIWQKKDYRKQDNLKRYQRNALTNYDIIEENDGQIVGMYMENVPQNAVERGKLSIPSRVPRDEHLYIMLGTLALCEYARRHASVTNQGRSLPGFLAMATAF